MFEKNEKAISDHVPYTMYMKNYVCFSFNMMSKMAFNKEWKFINNGFSCLEESNEAYKARLRVLASRLKNYIKTDRPFALLLQEGPVNKEDNSYDYFVELLTKKILWMKPLII